jgi:hypothetical protein
VFKNLKYLFFCSKIIWEFLEWVEIKISFAITIICLYQVVSRKQGRTETFSLSGTLDRRLPNSDLVELREKRKRGESRESNRYAEFTTLNTFHYYIFPTLVSLLLCAQPIDTISRDFRQLLILWQETKISASQFLDHCQILASCSCHQWEIGDKSSKKGASLSIIWRLSLLEFIPWIPVNTQI